MAKDINGTEIKKGNIVKIMSSSKNHHWLREGNTLRVAYWEDRSFFQDKAFIVVFLESKKGGKLCSQGIEDKNLLVVEES